MRNNHNPTALALFSIVSILLLAPIHVFAQSISIISPSEGQAVLSNSSFSISWSSSGIAHFQITYTTNLSALCNVSDNGQCENNGWLCLQDHPYGDSATAGWTGQAPQLNSTAVRIRVEGHDESHATINNSCSQLFTIASVPMPPRSLVAVALNKSAINISWAAQQSNELVTKYMIYRDLANIYSTTDNNTLAYIDNGLTPSTQYNYTLKAFSPVGESAFSNTASATTLPMPPHVNLTSPINGLLTNSTSLNLTCSATGSSLKTITLYGNWSGGWHTNATQNVSGSADSSTFPVSLAEGHYSWNCLAAEASGPSSFAASNYTFIIDTTPPSLNITSPTSNSIESVSRNITFRYIVGDSNPIASCNLSVAGMQGKPASDVPRATEQSFSMILPNGNYNWSISCKDSAGNINTSGTFMLNVSVPDMPPAVQLFSPADSQNTTGFVTFICGAEDDFGLANISLYHNITGNFSFNQTASVSGAAANVTFAIQNIQPGTYIWSCRASDSGGRTAFAAANRTFRTLEFSITVTRPAGGDSWRGGSVQEARWGASGNFSHFSVCYALGRECTGSTRCADSGWSSIMDRVSETSFDWTVPPTVNSDSAAIMVEGYDYSGSFAAGKCSGTFSIYTEVLPATPAATQEGQSTSQQETSKNASGTSITTLQQPAQEGAAQAAAAAPAAVEAQPAAAQLRVAKSIESLTAGQPSILEFNAGHISNISILPLNNATGIGLEVTTSPPLANITPLSSYVFEYMDIAVSGNISLQKALITFFLERNEMEGASANMGSIALYHMEGGKWLALPTRVIYTEGNRTFFEAETRSFSLFAIGVYSSFSLTGLLAFDRSAVSSIIIVAAIAAGFLYYKARASYFAGGRRRKKIIMQPRKDGQEQAADNSGKPYMETEPESPQAPAIRAKINGTGEMESLKERLAFLRSRVVGPASPKPEKAKSRMPAGSREKLAFLHEAVLGERPAGKTKGAANKKAGFRKKTPKPKKSM